MRNDYKTINPEFKKSNISNTDRSYNTKNKSVTQNNMLIHAKKLSVDLTSTVQESSGTGRTS